MRISDWSSDVCSSDLGAAPAAAPAAAKAEAAAPAPAASAPADDEDGGNLTLSPAVRRLVLEHGLDPSKIKGTGKDGRLTQDDVVAAAAAGTAKPADRSEDRRVGKAFVSPRRSRWSREV